MTAAELRSYEKEIGAIAVYFSFCCFGRILFSMKAWRSLPWSEFPVLLIFSFEDWLKSCFGTSWLGFCLVMLNALRKTYLENPSVRWIRIGPLNYLSPLKPALYCIPPENILVAVFLRLLKSLLPPCTALRPLLPCFASLDHGLTTLDLKLPLPVKGVSTSSVFLQAQ